MIPQDPERLAAFMRGETDDPGEVRAVRGGIQYPQPRDEMNHGLFSVVAAEVFMGLLMFGEEDPTEVLLGQFDTEQLSEIIAKSEILAEMAARIRRSQ